MGLTLPVTVIFLTGPLIFYEPVETKEIHPRPTATVIKSTNQPIALHPILRYASKDENKTIIAGTKAKELQEQQTTTFFNAGRFVYAHPLSNNDTLYIKHLEVGIPSNEESVTEDIQFRGPECSGAKKECLNFTNLPNIKRVWNVSEKLTVHNKTISETDNGLTSVLEVKPYIDAALVLLISLPAIIGNILIIIIFIRYAEMRTLSNSYIFTMAMGDFLCIIINLLLFFSFFLLTNQHWNFGTYVCKLFFFASDLSVALSIFGLSALSIQRYCGILAKPFLSSRSHFCFSKRMKVCHILFVWTASFLLALRTFITADVVNGRCESVTNHELSRIIAVVNFIIFAIFPLLLLAVFHALTARRLFIYAEKIPGADSITQNALKRARKKGARIILASTFIFLISYVPWFLWQIIFLWGSFKEGDKRVLYSFWVLYYLFFGSVCFNPIALYCISTSFRRLFQHYLCCCGFSNMKTVTRKQEGMVTETSFTVPEVIQK